MANIRSSRTALQGSISPTEDDHNGLLPTPALPTDLPAAALTENARQVLVRRYVRRGPDGKPAESVEEMFWRVAYHVAAAETQWGSSVLERARAFYILLTSKRFFPNSPTFTGAGTPLGQLAACFVLPIADDMGRDPAGIFQTLRDAALIQQTGGGNGFSFSRLRPKGALVKSSAGQATGPVGFLRVYDKAFGEVAQGGCLLPETLVFTDHGLLRLDEIAAPDRSGWQEHDLQVATDAGWRASPRAYNNGVAPILRVHTRQGLSLAGTPEHRVKVMTAQGPEWRTLQDLNAGDWILVQLGQQRGTLQSLQRPPRSHGNQDMPTLSSVLDEELAFFLGYLAGDGFVASGEGDHRVGVSVAHNSYLLEEMPVLLERLFGVQVHRQQKSHDRSMTYVMDNRAVKEYLQQNGLARPRSREAFVPRLVRQSPPQVVGAYLRGLFEADGTLSHGYPSLMTTSPRLVEEVATLLIGLGCPVSIRSMVHGVNHYGKLAIYQVRIESSTGLQAWRERIGCDQRSRFVVCHAWQADLSRETTYVLPYPQYWLQPVLESITLEQIDARERGRGINFRCTSPRLQRSILRYQRGDRHLTRSGYDELCRQYPEFAQHARLPEGQWFVRVEAVSQETESLTLDLEVEENHTYLAYGVVTHNTRRGANMAVLRVDHPDIEEFITCKTDENAITNFNISVGITDAFMEAVRQDADWELRFPDISAPEYKGFKGTLEQAEATGVPIKVHKTVRARDLFDKIVRQAHHNGEPGVLFLDAANRGNPVPHLYQLEATNPCFIGETRIPTEHGLLQIAALAELGAATYIATDNRAGTQAVPGDQPGVALRPASPAWMTRRNVPVYKLATRMGYSVMATEDHCFLTPQGYVALKDLRPSDAVLLQSGEGPWSRETRLPQMELLAEKMAGMALSGDRRSGHVVQRQDFQALYAHLPTEWSHELGLVMGTLVGEGWLSESSGSPLGMVFSNLELLEAVHQPMTAWFGPGHVHERGTLRQLTYGRVPYEFFRCLGVPAVRAQEKCVPQLIWTAPRPAVVGFLQGLFSADGSVQVSNAKKDCTIRLASSSLGLLQDVQILLSNFGILCRIYSRCSSGMKRMPDGKGGSAFYAYQPQYELVIGKANRDRFAGLIGFADGEKQACLKAFIAKERHTNQEAFLDQVLAVTPAGTADVYDLSQPQTASLIANGFVAHNCGEQFLGPAENCCLGSVNLARHLAPDGRVDWEALRYSVELSTIFLDDVVDANAYVPAVPELEKAAHRARRIGLGIMGLGDLLYHVGVRYGSPEGQEFAAQLMEFVRYHAMRTSIDLAKSRGTFPAIQGSLYDPHDLKWRPPQSIVPTHSDWGRPKLDWSAIETDLRRHGIRNAAQTTVAPTGTIATVAGCEGYGCEPVFALAYIRHVNDNGKDLKLAYASPLFEQALMAAGLDEAARQAIVDHVMEQGSCQGVPETPEHIRHTFVVSQDISADEHVRMQAALQAFVDNSLSKCVTGDTLILTEQGLVPVASLSDMRLPDQFEPHDVNVCTPSGLERSDFFYYGGMRETRRVRLAHGYEIEGTPNHRVHALLSDGRVDFVPLGDLTVGDTVVLYMGQQVFGPARQALPLFRPQYRTCAIQLRFPEAMSPELAYVLGCITSEGSIYKNGVQVCNGDRELLERLGELFTSLFGLDFHITQDKRRESLFTLQIHSRPLRDWLLVALGMESGARNKTIPDCILRASRSEIAAFLRGLFLDAYMTLDGRMFGIGLASQALIRQLQVLFLNFGVLSGVHRAAEHAWAVTVSGQALEQLASFVEFDEVWKNQRIQARNDGRTKIRHNYGTLLPEMVTQHLHEMRSASSQSMRSLFGEQSREYQRARVNLLQGHRLKRDLGRQLYQHFKDTATPFAQQFFDQDREGMLYLSVQRIEAGFAEVFDISVPGSHAFIANGLCNHNTVNFSEGASETDVATAYQLAWELGCKGITVYVTGSRQKVVLETKATARQKEAPAAVVPAPAPTTAQPAVEQMPIWHDKKKPRPRRLSGYTITVSTPLGKAFVTINENGGSQPFEVFINTSKAGSDTAAVSEAIGRLVSYILRLASPIAPRERLKEVWRQLSGIGGGRSLGFGPNRVRSLPDGVSQALAEYLEYSAAEHGEGESAREGAAAASTAAEGGNGYHLMGEQAHTAPQLKFGDLCPECGQAAVVNEEGCRKCYACGFSEC